MTIRQRRQKEYMPAVNRHSQSSGEPAILCMRTVNRRFPVVRQSSTEGSFSCRPVYQGEALYPVSIYVSKEKHKHASIKLAWRVQRIGVGAGRSKDGCNDI